MTGSANEQLTGESDEAGSAGETQSEGWVPTVAGAHLRGRRVRDTKPEMALRRAVHALGMRYRVNRSVVGRSRPDLVFGPAKVAVFVDGCYWHACPEHGPRTFRGPNAERWRKKLQDNQQRDARHTRELQGSGWTVLRLWECEIKLDVDAAAQRVERLVRTRDR